MNLSITILLLIAIAGVSFWAFQDEKVRNKLIMHPYTVLKHKEYYRLLSSGFIHADFMHLAFNAYALYLFGGYKSLNFDRSINVTNSGCEIQYIDIFGPTLGPVYYILLFVLGVIVSDIPTLFKNQNNPNYFSLGASGGVSAVMFSTIVLYPLLPLQFILIPIPIPGFILGLGYLAYSYYADKNRQQGDNVGHSAHLYGAVFGVIFTIVMHPPAISAFFKQIIAHYF